MKFNIFKFGLAVIGVLALTAMAQPGMAQTSNQVQNALGSQSDTPPVVTDTAQFYTTAFSWLTSVDTNKDWSTIDFEVTTGFKQIAGVGAASDLAFQYDFKSGWNAGLDAQFSGVGSPINTIMAQGGYAVLSDHDVKLELNLRAGYDGTRAAIEVAPSISLTKLMTKNTYSRIILEMPEYSRGQLSTTPAIYAEVGFGHVRSVAVN